MTTNRYTAGPNLPEDVKLTEAGTGIKWSIMPGSQSSASLVRGNLTCRLALAAGWIVEEEAPPTFDEVLRKVGHELGPTFVARQASLSNEERYVWESGIAEARKRCEK